MSGSQSLKIHIFPWAVGSAFLALWLGGCVGKHLSLPESGIEPLMEANIEELVTLLDQRYKAIEAIKALVKIEAKTAEVKGAIHGTLLFQRPDHLRFQGFDPLGRTLFDLTARDEEIRVFLPHEQRVLTEEEEFSFLGGEKSLFKLSDFLEVLGASGGVYLDPAYMPALEKGETAYILYFFLLQDNRALLFKKLWLDRVQFRLIREEIFDPDGRRRMTIVFDQYQKIGDQWRPFRVKAELPGSSQLSLDYSEIQINPPLAAEEVMEAR